MSPINFDIFHKKTWRIRTRKKLTNLFPLKQFYAKMIVNFWFKIQRRDSPSLTLVEISESQPRILTKIQYEY